jgi:protoporphyrinogen oxidase
LLYGIGYAVEAQTTGGELTVYPQETGRTPVVILGAGPAGLGAAYKLAERGSFDVAVLERNAQAGGNAGSFDIGGLRVDFGSHRLHPSCPKPILNDIRSMLGDQLLDRPRHGRIRLRGHWVHFPLKPVDLIAHLPFSFILGVAGDSLRKVTGSGPSEDTFEGVLERGLGRTICRDFYFPYARKIWGVKPDELDAEQARRRVSAGSLGKMVRKIAGALPGLKPAGAGRFYYPAHGFGSISEAYGNAAEKAGARILLNSPVSAVELDGRQVRAVHADTPAGPITLPVRQALSTIPVSALVRTISPAPDADVLEAAHSLRFRAMILIYMVLGTDQFTEYDAHYFPDADIAITRLSEPKNYGLANLPGRTVLCAELPCTTSDQVWTASDDELGRIMQDSLALAGLPVGVPVQSIVVRRIPHAYPIYTRNFRQHLDRIDDWIRNIDGLLTFGRQGLFAHDNTHHTLAMAYAAVECLSDKGDFDMSRWNEHRRSFEHHVVED